MSIQSDINELQSINIEIKNIQQRLKHIRNQKKKVENRINNFLKEKQQPGVKYKGVAITVQDVKKRSYKKKQHKKDDGCYILNKYGINNSKQVLEELLEAMRGSPEYKPVIKMKNIK